MKFILGTKAGMTQVFDENGVCTAATILKVAPAKVSQVKTTETDGYAAVQIASGVQKDHRVAKAQKGHFKGSVQVAREFRPRTGTTETTEGLTHGADAAEAVARTAAQRPLNTGLRLARKASRPSWKSSLP